MQPEGILSLHLSGIHTADSPPEQTSGQYEISVPNFSRAITALLRALHQGDDGFSQPLCSTVSNIKLAGHPVWKHQAF